MKLISNQETHSHLSKISDLLDNADEIIFCVAFLKNSGLKSIAEKLKSKATKSLFFIGTDFYLTEPSALRRLFKDGHKVYITKKERTTYHPKIFYFKKDNSIDILIGSTNLTSGGLETNIEASLALNTNANSIIDTEFKTLLATLNEHSTLITNDQIILDYETRYLAYRTRHKQADIDFEIDLLKIIEQENEREIELEKLKKSGTGNSDPKQVIVKIRPEDYEEFPIFLPKYVDYTTNIGMIE
jgi:HKD family nuclease